MRAWLQNNTSYLPRFVISGGLVATVDFGSYSLLYLLGMNIASANIIGMLVGFIAGFYLHKNITFRVRGSARIPMFGRYLLAFLVNLVIAYYCLQLFHQYTGEAFIAKIVTMFIVFFSNFLISRYFVFTVSKKKFDAQ